MNVNILIFRIRKSRLKARELALKEVEAFLNDIPGVEVVIGGPLSTEKGIVAAYLPKSFDIDLLAPAYHKLGYIDSVYIMLPEKKGSKKNIKWKGDFYSLHQVYEEDKELTRNQAPDKRTFLLPDKTGGLRYVTGYRGNGTDTGKRALPIEDCKFMLNISNINLGQRVLDVFAGAGGIVYVAVQFGLDVYSTDIDEEMQYGLRYLGSKHYVADVINLPFDNNFFDSIVTEAPFDIKSTTSIVNGLGEMKRVLKTGGYIVLMVANYQAEKIRERAVELGLTLFIDMPLDRKGTSVHIFKMKKI